MNMNTLTAVESRIHQIKTLNPHSYNSAVKYVSPYAEKNKSDRNKDFCNNVSDFLLY